MLDGRSAGGGLRRAVAGAIRHPVRAVVVFAVPSIGLLLAVVPSVLAASAAWHAVQVGLSTGDPLVMVVSVVAFVALWIGGLVARRRGLRLAACGMDRRRAPLAGAVRSRSEPSRMGTGTRV